MSLKIFLDSGAFSANSVGKPISIKDYIDYVQTNIHNLECYANLDVIGDAEASWENQELMEKEGLHPLPVFHVEDDFKYLDKCLEYDYFCLGGMVGGSSVQRLYFLDRCWKIICGTPNRLPKCKVHGFGVTSLSLLTRYPWYSVDSTSWVQFSRYGAIIIPKMINSNLCYNCSPHVIFVSTKSNKMKIQGEHIDSVSDIERRYILSYLMSNEFYLGSSTFEEVDGKQVETILVRGVSNDCDLRDQINILFYLNAVKTLPKWPWSLSNKGIFL